MHVNAHKAHSCVVRFRAIFLATGVLSHRLHHLQRFNRRCSSSWFWETYTLRTCLWLSADPLPSRKKQKSTIACTCLSRTINSAKWTHSSTLQRIVTGLYRDQATLTGSKNLHEECKSARPHLNTHLTNQQGIYFGHLSDSLQQGNLRHGNMKPRNIRNLQNMTPKAVSRAEVQQIEEFVTLISCHSSLLP